MISVQGFASVCRQVQLFKQSPAVVGDAISVSRFVWEWTKAARLSVCLSVCLQGTKSSKEKFAGALFTTTVEAFVPTNGRGIQVS